MALQIQGETPEDLPGAIHRRPARPLPGSILTLTRVISGSIAGSITRTLTVGGTQGDPVVDDSIPGYLGIMIFISASIFVTSLIIYKKIKKK